MYLIKLEAITTKAAQKLREYGDIWKVMGSIGRPDPYYFDSIKSYLYVVPNSKSSKMNFGAMCILLDNDPNYEYQEL